MRRVGFASEQELAAVAIAWLVSEHWDVYQEVKPPHCGTVADIVALRGCTSMVVECKMSFGLAVLDQAMRWRGRANYVAVSAPHSKAAHGMSAKHLMEETGIGYMQVSDLDKACRWLQAPRLLRKITMDWRAVVKPEHKTYAAAGGNGGYWSPFNQTCRAVSLAVQRRPGITMKELMVEITHHYASDQSARQSLLQWIEAGKIDGVRAERDGRTIHLFGEVKP